jgi:hypothetical protein
LKKIVLRKWADPVPDIVVDEEAEDEQLHEGEGVGVAPERKDLEPI